MTKFTVAVSHPIKNNGSWEQVTDGYFPVVCWNRLAGNVESSLKKGSRVVVAGKLTQRSFETDTGKRTVVEIVASQVAADLSFATAEIRGRGNRNLPRPSWRGKLDPQRGPNL